MPAYSAYYLIRHDGTATGDAGRHTTLPGGDFTTLGVANFYKSVEAALAATTAPSSNDVCLASHLHNNAEVDTFAPAAPTATQGTGVKFISVDDSDMTVRRAGATESTAASRNMLPTGTLYFEGFTINCDLDINPNPQTWMRFRNCHLNMTTTTTNRAILLDQHGAAMEFYDCTIEFGNGDTAFVMDNGTTLKIVGGSIVDTAALGVIALVKTTSSTSGAIDIHVERADLSVLTNIIGQVGELWNVDGSIKARIIKNKVNPSVVYHQVDFSTMGKEIVCAGNYTTSDDDHQYEKHTLGGDIVDQTTIYRSGSPTMKESGDQVALQVDTNTSCSVSEPVIVDCLKQFVDLSQTESDKIIVRLVSTSPLTDDEVWVDVRVKPSPGGTAPTVLTSRGTGVVSGTALTDDSTVADWKDGVSDLTGYNEYRIEVDTSSLPALDQIAGVDVVIGEPSIQAFVDIAYTVE